jgi:hypothetical protein
MKFYQLAESRAHICRRYLLVVLDSEPQLTQSEVSQAKIVKALRLANLAFA